MPNIALILGGTGLVGRHVLERLIAENHWDRVIAVTRRSLDTGSEKVTEVMGGADTVEDIAARIVADTVFCCIGTTQKNAGGRESFRKIDHDYVIRLAEIAHQNGAKNFVLISSHGARLGSPSYYLHVKGEIERDLQAIGFETLDILRPSLLLGKRDESRLAEEWGGRILPLFDFLMIGPLRKFRPIRAEQVAKAMSAIALQKGTGVTIHASDELASF
ncbi:NAD(P)H-binding protein [Ruegeria sp. 2012CJ41-6]|uniref:NAD(P)H-binding protein n=1 Tax=Ruegeria spongiae TaxID=2942209 RepID=A0ABT0PXZ3_9RHOB|nr:NAD-dependent epimerase/dehydratase family protein [Ruegeria spongiae]MCL6282450.1 NAD(P)H-binding protein [Ruegeria spongiae]